MRIVMAALFALALVPAAGAKDRMTLSFGDSTPSVGKPLTVSLRLESVLAPTAFVRLVAAAPGRNWYEVAGVLSGGFAATSGDSFPRDGFAVKLSRVTPHRWQAAVYFPRPGRWVLVMPNWDDAPGLAMPTPIVRHILVRP